MNTYRSLFSGKLFAGLMIALFLLFLITPGINDTDLANSTISSKAFFFSFFLAVILGLSVAVLFAGKVPVRLRCSKIDAALLVWVGYIVLNRYIIQPDQGFSIRFMELQGLGILYILLRCVPVRRLLLLFPAVMLSGIIQAVYGVMQLTGYLPSVNTTVTGGFQNSGPYAGYLAITGCLAFGIYLFRERLASLMSYGYNEKYAVRAARFLEWIAFAGMASAIIVLPATRSRAAWVTMAAGLVLGLIYQYRHFFLPVTGKLKHAAGGMRLFLGGMVFLLLAWGGYSMYQLKKGSADGRMLIWKVTGQMIREKPIFGVGFDRFKTHYMNAQAAYLQQENNSREGMLADNTYYAFNELLQLLAENGVTGFLLVVITAVFCFRVKVDEEFRLLKAIALAVILSVFVFGLFSYPMQLLPVKMILVLLLALLANMDRKKISVFNTTRFVEAPALRWAVIFAGMALAAATCYQVYNLQIAFRRWGQALTIYNYESYAESLSWFNKVYPVLRNDGDFLMNYGKALAMAGQNAKAVSTLKQAQNYINTTVIETALGDSYKALKRYDEAEAAYTRACRMTPNRFYPEYLLARLYQDTGQKEKAYKKATQLLVKEIKVPSRAIEEIKEEMQVLALKTRPDAASNTNN